MASAAALIVLAAGAACQPAPAQPTLVPTIAIQQATAEPILAAETPAYPVETEPAAVLPEELPIEDYPVEPGPAGVPVIENLAVVTGRMIEQTPDPERPDFTVLRVEILSSEDIAGMQNFTHDRVNQEIELLVETAQMPALQPGENFTAEVAYRGDEWGGNFYGQKVVKITP